MNLVLFDCDGTLVDSAHIIHDCMARSFVDHGYDAPSVEATKSIIGLTLDKAIARLLRRDIDVEVTAMTAHYKSLFNAIRMRGDLHEPMYEGVRPLIDELSERDDVLLGVVTGKSRRGLGAVLEKQGLEQTFVTLRTADDCPSKPHPGMVLECCGETGVDPQRTVVVGDAIFDMQMARAAGAIGIGVSWGYSTPAALSEAGATAVIDKPADLLDWITAPVATGA